MAQQLPAFALASLTTFGVVAAALFASSPARAQHDNPTMGDTPCVVLSRYIGVEPTDLLTVGGTLVHRAEVRVANVCDRNVEAMLCFTYAKAVDGVAASCLDDLLWPWGETEIHTIEAPTPLAGPTVKWRWVAGPSGAM